VANIEELEITRHIFNQKSAMFQIFQNNTIKRTEKPEIQADKFNLMGGDRAGASANTSAD
jgi:hypothetical protein